MKKKIFVSKKAEVHSSKGDFAYSRDGKRTFKMTGGGHGEENIDFLKSKKIPHEITWQYKNGFRGGNVSIHRRTNHRVGGMQCWFPENWSRKEIANAGRYVMSLKRNKKRVDQKTHWGTHKGVIVGVKTNKGRITTIFPNYVQKGDKYE